MAESNKSYRIRTTVGREADTFLNVHLDQEYDSLEILSLKISDKDTYKLHNSDYGVIVGRVLANGNFGVPNAKISVFIPADEQNSNLERWELYPYTSTRTKNSSDIRYNLLPDQSVKDCHKAVGTFPNKTYLLENDSLLEVFDDYYIYTTRTNAAGDYLICGVPTGTQTLHMDLDLSDCGILSQRPRDFVYKGYTIEQFENPNQFKKDENIDGLAQIFSQDQPVYVQPFWGNKDNGDEIGITRADIQISFKFEPTCVFMGSAVSDNASNGVSKKCVPTNQMGAMDELTAGEGTIEMIRKTPGGNVEEFSIKGNQVINGNGVWCYQIPMNLDFMMTDEYGNMVPTDDPDKGIPTRARVRFRASLTDMEGSSQSYYRAKFLIPNNPSVDDSKVDYNFGTYTDESSYRDLFWNGVYTVKSYIPRFQKSQRWRSERFSGIKACNYYGGNNPMPYNNLRIKLPFMFTVLCIFVKLFIKIVTLVNRIIAGILRIFVGLMTALTTPIRILGNGLKATRILRKIGKKVLDFADYLVGTAITYFIKKYGIHCIYIGDGLCPDMEGWYFAPGCAAGIKNKKVIDTIMDTTLAAALGSGDNLGDNTDADKDTKEVIASTEYVDETSIDVQNTSTDEEQSACLTLDVDYLVNCFEMNLAQEYRVIKFDFYNDWVNGVIYFPRWMRKVKRKKRYKFSLKRGTDFITTYYKDKIKGCMNAETSNVKKSRYYTQQCSLDYVPVPNSPWVEIATPISCKDKPKRKKNKKGKRANTDIFPSKCHKKPGMDRSSIFGKKSGLVTEETTMLGQFVYYLKPCEWKDTSRGKMRTLLFATDIVLLGTLNDCDENGIPQAFKYLNNSSYIMPTNLALTTMDDDAYIYVSSGGTVCSSSKTERRDKEETVNRYTPNYETTYSAYTRTEDDGIQYGENDDPIPITEAAGITWNYSGPGQDDVDLGKPEKPSDLLSRYFGGGNKRYNFLYYPGGHFLGLSCANSESNIKSCVNLKRICEVGATMSQRREELRGYTAEGEPKYRYYVPTGLITNVDIEGAAFRSMFATLNHNVLNATKRNATTGYKMYDFRFLRPDGFDGGLAKYVHKSGSPYNKVVNDSNTPNAIMDETLWFEKIFGKLWERPLDYDPLETKYTERRTVEDTINDYYMFRFGLKSFADVEQRKHYLLKKGGNYKMPQYENSFYFYFGLKDGSTALDEFKKQFFSECETNNIMKAPLISVVEKIDDDLNCSASLLIDNMLPPFALTFTDNTTSASSSVTIETEVYNLEKLHIPIIIGHEYTVTVTDSLDQTLTKTFVFGASAVKAEMLTVHFRRPGTSRSTALKQGGYVKVNDEITILKQVYKISSNDVSLEFREIVNGVERPVTVGRTSYTDMAGELWQIYLPDHVGTYEVYVKFHGKDVAVYNTIIEDNTEIDLCVACDYLSYKNKLKNLGENDWNNDGLFKINSLDGYLMRHSYYRQTPDDTAAYDCYVYAKGVPEPEIAIFGQPEQGGVSGALMGGQFYRKDYDKYVGYSIDDRYNFHPTFYEPNGDRNHYDVMAYTDDGRAAADASTMTVTGYAYNPNDGKITLSGNFSTIPANHGAVVVFENESIIFPVKDGNNLVAYSSYDIYPTPPTTEILSYATVYPTLRTPVVYKPFYAKITAATWVVQEVTIGTDDNGATMAERLPLEMSYKVEGRIYNGLSYANKFSAGPLAASEGIYETYLMFRDDSSFYGALSPRTEDDWQRNRELRFGRNTISSPYFREVSNPNAEVEPTQEISYGIMEGGPVIADGSKIRTARYEDGIDLMRIGETFSLGDIFNEEIAIKVINETSGTSGPCVLYSKEPLSPSVEYFRTTKNIFNDNGALVVLDGAKLFTIGYYNQNAEFDTKGSLTSVQAFPGGKLVYSITQNTGTKIQKVTDSEANLYNSGITLIHKYTINPSTIQRIERLDNPYDGPAAVDGMIKIADIATEENPNTGTQFIPTANNTIIAKYTRQPDGSKNEMTIYRFYPIGALDVMFPSSAGGTKPFISIDTLFAFSNDEQTVGLPITSNVKFKVAKVDGPATVNTTTGDATTTSISVTLPANTSSAQTAVSHIRVTVDEPGVTTQDVPEIVVEIIQCADPVGAIEQRMNDMEDEMSDMQDEIDDLRPTPTTGGTEGNGNDGPDSGDRPDLPDPEP